jgi:hypothetical protein
MNLRALMLNLFATPYTDLTKTDLSLVRSHCGCVILMILWRANLQTHSLLIRLILAAKRICAIRSLKHSLFINVFICYTRRAIASLKSTIYNSLL